MQKQRDNNSYTQEKQCQETNEGCKQGTLKAFTNWILDEVSHKKSATEFQNPPATHTSIADTSAEVSFGQ